MDKKTILRAVAVGALVLPQAAGAQETAGGVTVTLGFEERLSAGRNLALETPSEGRTYASDTALSFGVTSVTPLSRLSVSGGTTLRLADEPGGRVSEFERPRLSFVYARESVNSALEVTGSYRRDRVDFLRDLASFLDDEGNLDLPDDFEDLTGEGTRADYALDARLELGRTAPLGLTFEAGLSGTEYEETTSAALTEIRRHRLGVEARLTFSPVTEGRIALDRATSEEEDALETEVTTDRLEIGVTQELSPRSRIEAAVGYVHARTEELGALADEEKGLTGRIGYEWDMPDGRFDALLETTRDDDGARTALSFGRSRDLPLGRLDARLGLSAAEGGDPAVFGRLDWRQSLPDGGLSASLGRSVDSTDAGESATTTLALNWSRDVTEISGVSLGVTYVLVTETGENDIARAGVTAAYNHALTEDWSMNLGLAWRMRNEETVGSSTSEDVFLLIRRNFSWRQ